MFFSKRKFSDGTLYKATTKGNFTDGYEDGKMSCKIVYLDGSSTRTYKYKADMGTYKVIRKEDGDYVYAESADGWYLSKAYKDALEDNGAPRRKD